MQKIFALVIATILISGTVQFTPSPAYALTGGSVFLTCHDPDFHSETDLGARKLLSTGIDFVTDSSANAFSASGIDKFLFVETAHLGDNPPSGHGSGYITLLRLGLLPTVDFERHGSSTLDSELDLLGLKYNAIVVPSDFGGVLVQAELDILNSRADDISDFLASGGGLFAMAESGFGQGLTSHGHFDFLPFNVDSVPLNQDESGTTLTTFGKSLGLVDSDVNANFSHCIFENDAGLEIVDMDSNNRIISIADRVLFNDIDGDKIADENDNCPTISNLDQSDLDADGIGDVCDSTPNGDHDSDGVDNLTDNCPFTFNPDQADSNGNGIGDACDDTTSPIILALVDGILGDNGWYTSDVSISWSITDEESDISSTEGCSDTIIDSDTLGITLSCTATSFGGTDSESVTIKRDATAPIITAPQDIELISQVVVSPNLGEPVANDNFDDSPIITNDSPSSFDPGTSITIIWTATDDAGNSSSDTQLITIKTPPQTINELITLTNGIGSNTGVLKQAVDLLTDGNQNNDVSVCGKLDAFINQVSNSNHLSNAEKDLLIQSTTEIKTALNC